VSCHRTPRRRRPAGDHCPKARRAGSTPEVLIQKQNLRRMPVCIRRRKATRCFSHPAGAGELVLLCRRATKGKHPANILFEFVGPGRVDAAKKSRFSRIVSRHTTRILRHVPDALAHKTSVSGFNMCRQFYVSSGLRSSSHKAS